MVWVFAQEKKKREVASPLAALVGQAEKPSAGDVKADKTAVVKANNEFALELYAKLRGQEGNLFFSPYSISTALAMTYGGARGQTAAEIAKTLHFPLEDQRLHAAFGELIRETNGYGMPREYQLSVANALWVQRGYPFHEAYLTLTKHNYGTRPRAVDFVGDSEGARQAINAWVEKQTQGKITDLFKSRIHPLARLVLANAIYFKGNWTQAFDKKQTKPEEDFLVSGDRKVKVDMMHQAKARFRYWQGDAIQALEMPYGDGDLAMVVVLPTKVDGLAQLEESLTSAKLTEWLAKLREQEVVVDVPRFKVSAEFQLNGILVAMGMPSAFLLNRPTPVGRPRADFTGMTDQDNGRLGIGQAIHKAYVEVNEEGTEAAAATGIGIVALAKPAKPPVFRANHPFVFLIRDCRNGSILFLGRLLEPPANVK
jgi:serpin B